MKALLIIFILIFNLDLDGQEKTSVAPIDMTCGRQLDVKDDRYYYSFPDQPAEFPGGNVEFLKYFQKNLILPKDTCDYQTIQLIMAVQSNGTAVFIKIAKPKDCINLEIEIKRLISEMPKWKPAKCNGQLVDHRFYIPIHVNLK